jgi:hydrogenase-4 component B
MDSIQLLLLSVSLFGAGALASLLLNGFVRVARYVSGVAGIIAATVGVAAVIRAFVSPTRVLVIQSPLPFGAFSLTMDGLAAFMV